MQKLLFNYRNLIVSFFVLYPLLIGTSWGSKIEEEKTSAAKSTQPLPLSYALEAFEKGDDKAAGEIFTELAKAGAVIPKAYLDHLKLEHPFSFEPMPEAAQALSKSFFDASLAYRNYLTHKQQKKVTCDLGIMILNGNAHALSLFRNIYEKDKSICNYLPNSSWVKKIKTVEDLNRKFSPAHLGPVQYWNCVDPNNCLSLYSKYEWREDPTLEKAWKAFEVNYKKAPNLIGQIALSLAQLYPNQGFWSHLAVENGVNAGCLLLGINYYRTLPGNFNTPLSSDQKVFRQLSRFSLSQIQQIIVGKKDDYFALINKHITYYRQELDQEKENASKLRACCKLLADQGDPVGQANYSVMCYHGKGGRINFEEARKYAKMVADQEHLDSIHSFAFMNYKGEGGILDLKTARAYFKRAAVKGHVHARFFYAVMCLYGEGGPINLNEARTNLKIAADAGLVEAQSIYANMCQNGEGGNQDTKEAFKYYKLAAEGGDAAAQCNLGMMFFEGKIVKQDLKTAREFQRKSAEQGHEVGQFNYAFMLYHAEEQDQDLEKAYQYCKDAANKGVVKAIILLHKIENERNERKNLEKQTIINIDQNTEQELKNQNIEIENLENEVTISMPILEESPEIFTQSKNVSIEVVSPTQDTKEAKHVEVIQPQNEKIKILTEIDETKLQKELLLYDQQNLKWNSQSRVAKQMRKQAKKEAASRTRHTLKIKKNDYEETCKNMSGKMEFSNYKKKSLISYETLEFVKAIFGQGVKINTFSNAEAKKAFSELGCSVGNKKGENSTSLSFNLGGDRRMELDYEQPDYQENNDQEIKEQKVKYHNPHGHGDNKLYNALKPHLKRFLTSIHKTPETLMVKQALNNG